MSTIKDLEAKIDKLIAEHAALRAEIAKPTLHLHVKHPAWHRVVDILAARSGR